MKVRIRSAELSDSTRPAGECPGQLARTYPDLNGRVALSLEQDEVVAPFRSLLGYLVLVFALTAIAVLGIALWLSLRLAAPPIDPTVDLHLVDHPAVPRLEDASHTKA